MRQYEVKEQNNLFLVLDKETGLYYLTDACYSEIAGRSLVSVEDKCRHRVIQQAKDFSIENTYQVVYLGKNGQEGIKGRFLIPARLAFNWLVVDNLPKALMIGGEALNKTIIETFESKI